MAGKKTIFSDKWLKMPTFSAWLVSVPNDKFAAGCRVCNCIFQLSNMGKQALTSHMKGSKHTTKLKNSNATLPVNIFKNFQCNNEKVANDNVCNVVTIASSSNDSNVSSEVIEASSSNITSEVVEASSSNKNKLLQSFLLSENVSKAEIIWCLHVVVEHMSFRSAARAISTIRLMCPDSEIVQKMQLQRTKIAYTIVHGIAPYFKRKLIEQLKEAEYLVVGFDESLNKVSQKQQMDLFVRFFDLKRNEVTCRYLTSVFLGHTCASDLLQACKSSLSDLDLKKIIQISMDGPNVNFKFLNDLKKELSCSPNDPVILDLGSCGIHTMHCAFKAALKATKFDIPVYLRSLYYLFKDVPARRADFIEYSGSTLFPKKFCGTRWGENSHVVKRAIEIHPYLLKYIARVEKDKKVPNCKSYNTVAAFVNDSLLLSKLSFFQMMAEQIEPFIVEFQGEAPMSPFLYESLYSTIYSFMLKFLKDDAVKSTSSLTDVDIFLKTNLKRAADVDLGYGVRANLKKAKPAACELDQFYKSCRAAYQAFVKKILERSPIKYKVTKGISCLDPAVISGKEVIAKKRLSVCLNVLLSYNWLSGNEADKIDAAYKIIFEKSSLMDAMKSYNRSCRLDKFWLDIIQANNGLNELRKFIKFILILSHGNAFVERGFSINAECILENQAEDSLIALRQVHDTVTSSGGIPSINICKSIIHSARNAYSFYKEALENKKRQTALVQEVEESEKVAANRMRELQMTKMKLLSETEKKLSLIDEEIKTLKK